MKNLLRFRSGSPNRRDGGMALIVTLSLIVLVTVAAMAFFVRATSNSSVETSRWKHAVSDQLAQTASDYLTGMLAREIITNSASYTNSGVVVYQPRAASNAVPTTAVLSTLSNNPVFPNLVRQSIPNADTNASSDGTASPSRNGRVITTNFWNKPMLTIGGGFSATNQTPNWIYVCRDGTITNSVTTPNASNIIGRFAYHVYNTGGLLDANVAGYPSVVTNSGMTNLALIKGTLAGADLTQLPNVTQTNVDQLVAYRNATITNSASNYVNYVLASASNGFLNALVVTNQATSATNTNNPFQTRQDLIRYATIQNTGLTNALPYLTHHTRALEQPSYARPTNLPLIVGSTNTAPSALAQIQSYVGNNSYVGGESAINLTGGGFLTNVVTTTFTRVNGTTAVPGEPLLKTKFALSRLTNVTSTAIAATGSPIHQMFGLKRSSTSSPWVYDHGIPGGTGVMIGTMAKVAAANREPDFAELLKAAINAGSVGKGAVSSFTNQWSMDVSGDLQILQIMANLIDQQKTDNYPTWIQFTDSTGTVRDIYGTQDLPYFYRFHYFPVVTRLPNPLLASTDTTNITIGATNYNLCHASTNTLVDPGSASYMLIPQIWNPHDANTPVAPVGGPKSFRLLADSVSQNWLGQTNNYWTAWITPTPASGSFDGAPNCTNAKPPITNTSLYPDYPVIQNNPAYPTQLPLQFSFDSLPHAQAAFREPTLMWQSGTVTGLTLAGVAKTDINTAKTYYGILLGTIPISWSNAIGGTNYIFQPSSMQLVNPSGPRGSPPYYSYWEQKMTIRMQYMDAAGNWITYQQFEGGAKLNDQPSYPLYVNTADFPLHEYNNPFASPNYGWSGGASASPELCRPLSGPYDPRSSRFSSCLNGHYCADDPSARGPTLGNPLDAIAPVTSTGGGDDRGYQGLSAAQNDAVASAGVVLLKSQRPSNSRGQFAEYDVPGNNASPTQLQMGWLAFANWSVWCGGCDGYFYDGMMSQNNPLSTLVGPTATRAIYYQDADGVCRRAMGAYVPNTATPTAGGMTTAATTIGLPMATASTSWTMGVGTPLAQSISRGTFLHRPFRSVAEMSYAFRGTPWKNIDFFTPESGDTALLDVFCVNEPPANALTAGKVNLNTPLAPVLLALLAWTPRDAANPSVTLTTNEASTIASTLLTITTNANSWQGPLTCVPDLVGHYVGSVTPSTITPDVYTFTSYPSTATSSNAVYAGFSQALCGSNSSDTSGSTIWNSFTSGSFTYSSDYSRNVQRLHEAPIRTLADCGQVRVWNLMYDVVAQAGGFPTGVSPSATTFNVGSENHSWIHVALDRARATVVDSQVETPLP